MTFNLIENHTSSNSSLSLQESSVSNDTLTQIIKKLICQDLINFNQACTLRTVCKHWEHIVNSEPIMRLLFFGLSLPFPKKPEDRTWKSLGDLQTGNFLRAWNTNTIERTLISYSKDIKIDSHSHTIWIGSGGFVQYALGTYLLKVCMLDHPNDLISIELSDELTAILTIGNFIVCGIGKGTIVVYSLEKAQIVHQKTVHDDSIIYLFAYKKGWISLSSNKIVYWDQKHEPTTILTDYYPCATDPHVSINQCYLKNNYLLIEYKNGEKFPFYYTLSLTSEKLQLVQIPKSTHAVLCCNGLAEVWGNEMFKVREHFNYDPNPFLNPHSDPIKYTICRFAFDTKWFFQNLPHDFLFKTIPWDGGPLRSSAYRKCIFRKNTALIITSDYIPKEERRSRGSGTLRMKFDVDKEEEECPFYFQVLDLEHNQVIHEFQDFNLDPKTIHLEGKDLLYMKPQSHEVIHLRAH